MILVSSKAWSKMKSILIQSNNKYGFLYSARSGGCNGFNFNLDLLNKQTFLEISNTKFHTHLSFDDTTHLYIDPLSELHLQGTSIDYITEDISLGQFENKFIFNVDPNLMTSCGCGISFSPK